MQKVFGSHRKKIEKLTKQHVKKQERELKMLRKKLKPKNSIEVQANKKKSDDG